MTANNRLEKKLVALHKQKFTGVLTITSANARHQWEVFFNQGQYLWAEGGYHPNRSWRRNFEYYCPGINPNSLVLRQQPEIRSLHYSSLNVMLQRKIVQRQQVKALIENYTHEVLFDLLQTEYNDALNYAVENTSTHYLLKAGFNLSLISFNLEQMLFKSQVAWSNWGSKGLASCSPHHAPLLRRDRNLQEPLPDLILTNMSRLFNGKRTLRDLAVQMDKNVLDLTCGIVPYFFKGYLRLLEIGDLVEAQTV